MKVKFTFYLKSGAVLDNITDLTKIQLLSMIETVRVAFRDGKDAVVVLDNCVVRVADCSAVDVEEFDEPEAEKS